MDMRGPGDEECSADIDSGCDTATTHCVQIKYYLAPWEQDDPENEADTHEKGTVCMCKRGYTPDPDDESACRKCGVTEACHEGDMNPPHCGHNSCDYYSAHCVPDVDSFLGFRCVCMDGFVPNPYNPLACTLEEYVITHGHKVITTDGETIRSGSYGDDQYSGGFIDYTNDAHQLDWGHEASGAHALVASTHEDYQPGTDFFSQNGKSNDEHSTNSRVRSRKTLTIAAAAVAAVAALVGIVTSLRTRRSASNDTPAMPAPADTVNLTPGAAV
jgi:hypothetical protein